MRRNNPGSNPFLRKPQLEHHCKGGVSFQPNRAIRRSPRHRWRACILSTIVGVAMASTNVLGQTDYTFTGSGYWSEFSNWTPEGVPGAEDSVRNAIQKLDILIVDGVEQTIKDLTITDLPDVWHLRGARGPTTLKINGTLSMNSTGHEVRFRSHSGEYTRLSVVANTIVAAGAIVFGTRENTVQALERLAVTGKTTIADGGSILLNIEGDANFADIVVNSGGELRIAEAPENTHRTITVASISGDGAIYAKSGGSGSNSATLVIGAKSGASSFSGTLADQGFGKSSPVLGLRKEGAGTQILTGCGNSYTGGTVISAGTLLVNNTTDESGLGAGEISVAGGVLGGDGVIALDNADINFTGESTLLVGDGDNPMGKGIVEFLIRKNSGHMNLTMDGDVTVRLVIGSTMDYGRLVFGSGSGALDSVDLAGATLRVDSEYDAWESGQTFQVIEWGGFPPDSSFGALELPEITSGLRWDSSELHTAGILKVVHD